MNRWIICPKVLTICIYCLGLRDKYMHTALVWFEKNAYTFNIIIRVRATTPLPLFKSIVVPHKSAHKFLLASKLIFLYPAQTLSRSAFFSGAIVRFFFFSLPSTGKAFYERARSASEFSVACGKIWAWAARPVTTLFGVLYLCNRETNSQAVFFDE